MKYAVVLYDGMADYAVPALGGKTPMELTKKPRFDAMAKKGRVGLVKTVAEGLKPGSDVANLSVLGYDPGVCYTGRSPLEAVSIGVKMNVDAAEWSLMQKRMEEKKFDAVTVGWALPWSTDPYQIWHSSQADVPKGSNTVGFRNKEADAIIESLRVTLDPGERARKLQDFHRILHREQPYTFVYIPKSAYCYRRGLENVVYAKERPLADLQPMWSSQTDG
jgi:ABC-type oligopeptide transport system substrate-binding subunit